VLAFSHVRSCSSHMNICTYCTYTLNLLQFYSMAGGNTRRTYQKTQNCWNRLCCCREGTDSRWRCFSTCPCS